MELRIDSWPNHPKSKRIAFVFRSNCASSCQLHDGLARWKIHHLLFSNRQEEGEQVTTNSVSSNKELASIITLSHKNKIIQNSPTFPNKTLHSYGFLMKMPQKMHPNAPKGNSFFRNLSWGIKIGFPCW